MPSPLVCFHLSPRSTTPIVPLSPTFSHFLSNDSTKRREISSFICNSYYNHHNYHLISPSSHYLLNHNIDLHWSWLIVGGQSHKILPLYPILYFREKANCHIAWSLLTALCQIPKFTFRALKQHLNINFKFSFHAAFNKEELNYNKSKNTLNCIEIHIKHSIIPCIQSFDIICQWLWNVVFYYKT